MAFIIAGSSWPRQSSFLRAKKSNSKKIRNIKRKHVNFDERGSQDVFQSINDQLLTSVGLLIEPSTV